ncbi:hypothetical protein ACFY0N_00635 [Streptomyces vinaceus]|uniref:hypothetical protein n=1 Tax=Streptomyces vinaceus TaxID=1960 RepID=UPI00368DEECC
MTSPRKTQRRTGVARILLGPHPSEFAPPRPTGHRYRCGACLTTYGPATTLRGAHDLRAEHRRKKHGGGVPDGEEIMSPPPLRLRDIRTSDIVGSVVVFAVLAILIYVRNF